ncbi:MAG: hypothetical protein J2P37_30095 [Ktedonobacteraceae bacterium]|nr:hypothetical protein [Ktedonobacteraceae bacterium]MBO0790297.1 hypothetical protein [Ktedonobacteraceae bacterium]
MSPEDENNCAVGCPQSWKVLLIGGVSGSGKTVVARQIGRQAGLPWMSVDDLRLALICSRATLPENSDALYFFQSPTVWRNASQRLCEGLIALGEVLAPAMQIVVENHIATDAALILEGDGILPSLLTRPVMQRLVSDGLVRAVFLVELEEQNILDNILARGRGIGHMTETELRTEAHAKWLFSRWLSSEAQKCDQLVIEPRPWETLVERVIAATSGYGGS